MRKCLPTATSDSLRSINTLTQKCNNTGREDKTYQQDPSSIFLAGKCQKVVLFHFQQRALDALIDLGVKSCP